MSRFYYVSHPQVAVDPAVAIPEWRLSDTGRQRAVAMLDQPWIADVGWLGSSPETKALETATIIGDQFSIKINQLTSSHEIDRSATGFVSHERHEELADRLFAEPTHSAEGWERAVDAQQRIVEQFEPFLRRAPEGRNSDSPALESPATRIAVGHGGVGTLLLCHLLGIEINRQSDQPGQGNYWAFDCDEQRVLHRWRPIDRIEPTLTAESPDTPDVVELL